MQLSRIHEEDLLYQVAHHMKKRKMQQSRESVYTLCREKYKPVISIANRLYWNWKITLPVVVACRISTICAGRFPNVNCHSIKRPNTHVEWIYTSSWARKFQSILSTHGISWKSVESKNLLQYAFCLMKYSVNRRLRNVAGKNHIKKEAPDRMRTTMTSLTSVSTRPFRNPAIRGLFGNFPSTSWTNLLKSRRNIRKLYRNCSSVSTCVISQNFLLCRWCIEERFSGMANMTINSSKISTNNERKSFISEQIPSTDTSVTMMTWAL